MSLVIDKSVSAEAKKDIIELRDKIRRFRLGTIDEEGFKLFRLARGVYGQRQQGVQMVRLKLPYGKITGEQLIQIANASDKFSNGNLHLTTRQNFQLHYVPLEDSPQLWAMLEEKGVTTREACGNTVRNITASASAGIDPDEPFDVVPYVEETFKFFLRNPICQAMGRKVKIAFSSSEKDSAFTYIHDFGFIPKIENGEKGFKVVIGGGLGAQAMIAKTAYDFLPAEDLIPFVEAGIRVFDRYGEREKRHKARMKFLLDDKRGLGLEGYLKLVEEEKTANKAQKYFIDIDDRDFNTTSLKTAPEVTIKDQVKYENWLSQNTSEQKQKGFYAVKVKLSLGNISTNTARALVEKIHGYVANDYRLTVNQGFLFRYATKENLPYLFSVLDDLNLAEPGFDSIADITACPGTDTCNLGVTNSTALSKVLEEMLIENYPHLVKDSEIRIKISGCMNACGQHMIANIGFHGSSIKNGNLVIPAMQVVIGGGVDDSGKGFIADKVIKLPSKRIPQAVSVLLDDYEENHEEGEYFNDYYQRNGKMYFYGILKPLANIETLAQEDYSDWGKTVLFEPEIGVGECAAEVMDVITTIISDAEEKLEWANDTINKSQYADSIYHSYAALVIGAKALLLSEDHHCNTHIGIINDFQEKFVDAGKIDLGYSFKDTVLAINKQEPDEAFALKNLELATRFVGKVIATRQDQFKNDGALEEKKVVTSYYNA